MREKIRFYFGGKEIAPDTKIKTTVILTQEQAKRFERLQKEEVSPPYMETNATKLSHRHKEKPGGN